MLTRSKFALGHILDVLGQAIPTGYPPIIQMQVAKKETINLVTFKLWMMGIILFVGNDAVDNLLLVGG